MSSHRVAVAIVFAAALLPGRADAQYPHDFRASGEDHCLVCHAGSTGHPMAPRGAEQEALCLSCHNPTGVASSMSDIASHVVDGGTRIVCGACHDPHAPNTTTDPHTGWTAPNLSLFRADTTRYVPAALEPAIFQMRPAHFAFAELNPPWNGACQTCHTSTSYHTNDGSGDHTHNVGMTCTSCHAHQDGFRPSGCTGCHRVAQGPRRQIVEAGGDFARTSHHVSGTIEDGDCVTCHYTGNHQAGVVQLNDPDVGSATVYDYDPANPAGIASFCTGCHDSDGAQASTTPMQPFSDGQRPPDIGTAWSASAHASIGFPTNGGNPVTCVGDGTTSGCHGNGHGSDNVALLSAGASVRMDTFCFSCHTEGAVVNRAISGSVDDIQQAFSLSSVHNLGTSITVGGNTYTMECTTCHNPHVVTGRHWDVDAGLSPVTRPDFTADPAENPRAMGTLLWGDDPGEKMDDFAARGRGSGGWYNSVARGGVIAFDQPAVYQPPRLAGGGWDNTEFAGDVLPDYATFCLDCHSERMGTHPPVNWGQGVACTGNSVDPPSQRVECGADHGLGRSNRPAYWGDRGMYGTSGNPDPIFGVPGVTRGRGAGHFMRWPYDSAHKNAGINFVMSCTDCHEAHGSSTSSMLRTTVNNGPGTPVWNNMCNNCHFFYGGHHAGMSCGNASCHEANSIHRIIHVGGSGGTHLWSPPSRPTTTPEIAAIEGTIGSPDLRILFTQGVWTNPTGTGAVSAMDLLLTDIGRDNPRIITSVPHTPGSNETIVTMSAPLTRDDLFNDIVATRGVSIWDADGEPAGPWPVTIGGACPTGAVTFDLNESAGSPYARDASGQLRGTVNSPGVAFLGDGRFRGAPASNTSIDFNSNATCLQEADAITIEAVVFTNDIDQDFGVSGAPVACTSDFECNPSGTQLCACGSATSSDRANRCPGGTGGCDVLSGSYRGCTASYSASCPGGETCCANSGESCRGGFCSTQEENATFNRIFQRHQNISVTILHTDYRGDNHPSRANRASIEVKYFTADASRHTCPHPLWPTDTYAGSDARWHQVSTDIDRFPIVANHWYRIRVVFNSGKARIPVDIFVDDLGTNGAGASERWSGFLNTAMPDVWDSSSCRWGAIPGDRIGLRDNAAYIGSPPSHSQHHLYEGLIDMVSWAPVADYTGLSSGPHL